MQLSVVSTLYRSESSLREFCATVTAAAASIASDFELILVNDGSPDGSLGLALELQRQDPRIVVVDLSRNFGHHRAMMTGLAHARGERVFLIDSDLEEDPALLGRFSETLERTGADVVYGFQEQRQGDLVRRWTGRAYYALFNALSETQLPENLCTIRLMTRRYVQSLLQHQERITNIAGLWALTGYEQVGVPIRRRVRDESAYTIAQRLTTLVDGVTAFSDRPLVLIFYLGLAISTLAAIAAGYLIVRRLFFGVLLAGWASVIVSIWLLGGIILFCVGLVGMYLSRIFVETKQRPYTIVRRVYGGGQSSSQSG